MELYNVWSSVTDFFHLAWYVQHSFILKHVSVLHFFIAKKYSTAWICHILIIHSSVDGYLACFHFLVIINNATMNIQEYAFVWTYVLISLG